MLARYVSLSPIVQDFMQEMLGVGVRDVQDQVGKLRKVVLLWSCMPAIVNTFLL